MRSSVCSPLDRAFISFFLCCRDLEYPRGPSASCHVSFQEDLPLLPESLCSGQQEKREEADAKAWLCQKKNKHKMTAPCSAGTTFQLPSLAGLLLYRSQISFLLLPSICPQNPHWLSLQERYFKNFWSANDTLTVFSTIIALFLFTFFMPIKSWESKEGNHIWTIYHLELEYIILTLDDLRASQS